MEVDFEAKTAVVAMLPGKTLAREDCDKAFAGGKYGVASFEPAGPPASKP